MKKINLQSSVLMFSLLLVTIIGYSCKRDSAEGMSQLNQALIGRAQQFYERETILFEARNRQVLSAENKNGSTYTNISVNPIWDEAVIETTTAGKKIVTVPIPEFKLESKTNAYSRKIIFATLGESVTEGQIVEVFSTPSEISTNGDKRIRDAADGNLAGFTGAVMTYNLNYFYKEGRFYENGVARNGIAKIAKGKSLRKGQLALPSSGNISGGIGKISVAPGSISAITPEFEGQDCENFYLVYIERDEFGNIVYWENRGYQYTKCKSANPDGPNPGGSSTDLYVDCNRDIYGSAYEDSCNNCVGGNTGLEPCPPVADIKLDSLKKYFPCMDKLVLLKLMNDTLFSKLINPFKNVYVPSAGHLSFRGLPSITYDFSSQVWGGPGNNYKLGETESLGAANSKVYFNKFAMQNASQLMLQVATIHETGHAYLNYYVKMGTWGMTIQEGGDFPWALKMVNYGAIASGQYLTANYTDHSIFLNHYLNEVVAILKSVNGSAYTHQEYVMAALYGMDNPGAIPSSLALTTAGQIYFETIKGQLQTTFNNVLTTNGITPAMLSTFYNNNIVSAPAAKKLPTTCP